MEIFWIVVWTCFAKSNGSIYRDNTYQVYMSSNVAYSSLINGDHSSCSFKIYEATATCVVQSR